MFEEPVAPAPRVTAEASVAVELDWALSAAHPAVRSGSALLPEFYESRPELAERVRSLWPAGEELSYSGYPELTLLAQRGGLLFGLDAGPLLDRLEDLSVAPQEAGGLRAETPGDRARIRQRLEKLQASKAARQRYARVVREVWAELGPLWEAAGRPAVQAAVETRRAALLGDPDPSWETVADCTREWAGTVRSLIAELPPDGEVAVVPAFFTRKGLVMDLPGLVVVGVRAEPVEATARQRAELLARRLKALAEPTRLAVLETLARRPTTISELAALFDLAQPTVSNHVKVLRDAGLVGAHGGPRSRELTLERESTADLLAELQRFLALPNRSDGGPADPPA